MENFNPGWFPYIKIIEKNEGIVSDELAKTLMVSKPAITKTIHQLIDANLCFVEVNDEDRRSKKLYLSEEGKNLISKMQPLLNEAQSKVLEGFSDEEAVQLEKMLNKVLDNINKN